MRGRLYFFFSRKGPKRPMSNGFGRLEWYILRFLMRPSSRPPEGESFLNADLRRGARVSTKVPQKGEGQGAAYLGEVHCVGVAASAVVDDAH
jgi:hypothetical protein